MRVTARRQEGFTHEVEIEGGHTVVIDEPLDAGGSDLGPPPTRVLAASLAACTAVTMEMYAARKGWDIGAVEVDVDASYEGATPTSFEVTLRLPGNLSEEQKTRLLVIAGKCPVHQALAGATSVVVAERIETL